MPIHFSGTPGPSGAEAVGNITTCDPPALSNNCRSTALIVSRNSPAPTNANVPRILSPPRDAHSVYFLTILIVTVVGFGSGTGGGVGPPLTTWKFCPIAFPL